MTRCRSCGAEIKWCVMRSGKRNPLDPAPDGERGNVLITDSPVDADLYDTVVGRGVQLSDSAALATRGQGVDLYLSHFVTCPSRDQHRAG